MKRKFPRRIRREPWTDKERQALLELGLLRFWPESIPRPEQIERERAILPYKIVNGQRIAELTLHTPEAKRFLREQAQANKHTKSLKGLNQRSELAVLCDWLNLRMGLWEDPTWRECMVLRYSTPNEPAVNWIDNAWRAKLDKGIRRLRRGRKLASIGNDEIMQLVYETADPYKSGRAMAAIGEAYVYNRLGVSPVIPMDIELPISESGVFRIVALRWHAENSASMELRPIEVPEFLLHPSIPSGHKLEWLGMVLYLLMEIERGYGVIPKDETHLLLQPFWPEPYILNEIRPSPEFDWIAARYAQSLDVPLVVFKEIFFVYHIVALEEYARRREAIRHKVFWFAKLLAVLKRGQHVTNSRLVAKIRQSLINPYLQDRPDRSRRKQWLKLAEDMRTLLNEHFGLSAVFHSEAFDGRSWLRIEHPLGRPERRAQGIAAAYAYQRLFASTVRTKLDSVSTVLEQPRSTFRPIVLTSIRNVRGNSPYSYLAPLITSVMPNTAYPLDRHAVLKMCNRYGSRVELRRFEGNPSEQLSVTQHWIKKNGLL